MIQHLSQEVNYLVRSNPLLMQGEEEVSSLAHRRQCGHSSPFSRDPPLGRLSAWRPRLAEERCQRNIRLVLKIENCPVFPHCLAYFGERIFQPFLACLGIRLEVLTFRFLIRQSCVTKPSPDRVLRHDDLQLLLYDLVYPCHCPQICFKPKLRRRLEDEVPKALAVYVSQLSGASASNLPMQPGFSMVLIAFNPPKNGTAIYIVCSRDLAERHVLANDSLHCSCPNLIRRVSSVKHSDGLSRYSRFTSRLTLQFYWDEPYILFRRSIVRLSASSIASSTASPASSSCCVVPR